jgi:hypothetical protein
MPVDLSKIEAFSKASGMRCAIDTILAGEAWKGTVLKEDPREMLREALPLKDRFSSTTLSQWLKSEGIDLGDSAINRHRNGNCRCARS